MSFPAQLVANSLLTGLADENQDFFESDYWVQGAHRPDEIVEEQRNLLRSLELRRAMAHRQHAAKPIRYIYVAWGLIRIDGKFLLHHREDIARRQIGNFVLPGGRLNLSDLPKELQLAEALPLIQRAGSTYAIAALERTLVREMFEEVGLRHREHFEFRNWRRLRPYREVEGAKNNHAFTEYLIEVFEVTLTQSGQVRLFEKLSASPDRFSWFSPTDLARKARPDGRAAYVEALHANLGVDLADRLEQVPESFFDQSIRQDETDSVDVPVDATSPLSCGRTGKERPVKVALTDEERRTLFGLAWHAKGLEFSETGDAVLLPSAWAKVSGADLQSSLNHLGEKLRGAGIELIECRDQEFYRVPLSQSLIFFDRSRYRYRCGADDVQGRDGWLQLCFEAVDTPFGRTKGIDHRFSITRNTLRIIETVEHGEDPEGNTRIKSGDIQRTVREQIDAHTKPLGLRKFLRIEDKNYSIDPGRDEVAE